MNKYFLWAGLYLLLFLNLPLQAQDKKLSIEDAVLNSALQPSTLRQLGWMVDAEKFTWVAKANNIEYLLAGNAQNNNIDTLLSLSQLNNLLTQAGGSALNRIPAFYWLPGNKMLLTHQNSIYTINITTRQAESINSFAPGAENTDLHLPTQAIAYTKGNNLFISKEGNTIPISKDSNEAIVNGQAAHRSEFGISKGTFWSPSGSKLAYYRMDQRMVTDYPLVNIEPVPAQLNPIKYPMAGQASHHVQVGVFDIATGNTIFLQTGEPAEQYLTNITWSPDEKFIYVAIVNRAQNHMKLNQYEAATGKLVKTVFEEKHSKYIEPEHGPIFLKNNPAQFIWQSERDGFNHLYLYNTNGKLIGQLTKGNYVVTEVVGFDHQGDHLLFIATAANALERHVHSLNLKNRKIRLLSTAKGQHNPVLSPMGNLMLDDFSSIETPRQISLLSTAGKEVKTIFKAENPLAAYKLGQTELLSLKAEDGTPLNARIIRPADFDPAKKYPVIVYLYGGPHVQLVHNTWLGGANLWMQYMAQQGYVVFTLDNRGSHNRGLAFEQATFRRLGTIEMADQLQGVNYLKSLPYVDSTRLGIHGWSFGGFMTTTLMTRQPDIFKAGVAGGPVIDWRMYEIMYTERYMDTPQENPEGYREASLLNYAGNLKGRLLMIHGTADDVVVWQHSQAFVKKCIDEGVLLDYMLYPGHAHNVRGKDRLHLIRKITQYFNDFL